MLNQEDDGILTGNFPPNLHIRVNHAIIDLQNAAVQTVSVK
jgi:hypothetical protein